MKRLIQLSLAFVLFINALPVLAHDSCTIKEQDGSSEAMWCRNHNQEGTIRCYANVETSFGEKRKIWGDDCYQSFADCWSNGQGAVEPRCSK